MINNSSSKCGRMHREPPLILLSSISNKCKTPLSVFYTNGVYNTQHRHMCKDHYTPGQPGIHHMLFQMENILRCVDPELLNYLK
eukprot:6440427-Ditylum_brightwellii.AAC.1